MDVSSVCSICTALSNFGSAFVTMQVYNSMHAKIDSASPPPQLTRRERELKSCWVFAVVAVFLLLLFTAFIANPSHNHRANLPKAQSHLYTHWPATRYQITPRQWPRPNSRMGPLYPLPRQADWSLMLASLGLTSKASCHLVCLISRNMRSNVAVN